jgi:TatD DNase family protein
VKQLTPIIDTHAHLDELENLDEVINKGKDSGIIAIISMGSNQNSNQQTLEISRRYPSIIYPALGLHPWELGRLELSQIESSLDFIADRAEEIVAIGEIGLDYDKRVLNVASKELQKDILKRILSLAKESDKPVSIHSRYAWKDCFNLVRESGIEKAVFHWFTGFSSVLGQIIEAGYFISATPAAEYHEEHRRAIKETPLEKLLLETDCPVTYGREHRYTSAPTDLLRSLTAVARLKGNDVATIARYTTDNAMMLFGLDIATSQ